MEEQIDYEERASLKALSNPSGCRSLTVRPADFRLQWLNMEASTGMSQSCISSICRSCGGQWVTAERSEMSILSGGVPRWPPGGRPAGCREEDLCPMMCW